jgi:hypothetical protein
MQFVNQCMVSEAGGIPREEHNAKESVGVYTCHLIPHVTGGCIWRR